MVSRPLETCEELSSTERFKNPIVEPHFWYFSRYGATVGGAMELNKLQILQQSKPRLHHT